LLLIILMLLLMVGVFGLLAGLVFFSEGVTNTNAAIDLPLAQYRFPRARLGSERRWIGKGQQCLCARHLFREWLGRFLQSETGKTASENGEQADPTGAD
jgi:hypothetical protein